MQSDSRLVWRFVRKRSKRLAEGDCTRDSGFEGRTLDVKDATLYVLSSWHNKEDLKVATLQQRTWKRRERAWKSEGMRKEERTFMVGMIMVDTLWNLQVFVMKKGGAYYLLTMLKYAMGRNSDVIKTLLDLHDFNRPSIKDDEGQAEDMDLAKKRWRIPN
jgi:hypothetical protein